MPEYIYTISVIVDAETNAEAFNKVKSVLKAADDVDNDGICQHDGGKLYDFISEWETV